MAGAVLMGKHLNMGRFKMRRLLLLCVLVLSLTQLALCGDLEVHFVDVGQGDCIFLRCPNGRTVLVDCGSLKGGNEGAVKKYLHKQLGDKMELDTLVITHPDQDHYNWIPNALKGVTVKKVIVSRPTNKFTWAECSDWLKKQDVIDLDQEDRDAINVPSKLFGNGTTKFYVLAADAEHSTNGSSVVLLVSYKDFDLLLMGDATKKVEKKILNDYPKWWLDCEILKVGHHGSNGSSDAKWLAAAKPDTSILSCAYVNGFKHPRKEVVYRLEPYAKYEVPHTLRYVGKDGTPKNLKSYDRSILSTATNGNVIVKSDGRCYTVDFRKGEYQE